MLLFPVGSGDPGWFACRRPQLFTREPPQPDIAESPSVRHIGHYLKYGGSVNTASREALRQLRFSCVPTMDGDRSTFRVFIAVTVVTNPLAFNGHQLFPAPANLDLKRRFTVGLGFTNLSMMLDQPPLPTHFPCGPGYPRRFDSH